MASLYGLDVSSHQGSIDWDRVAGVGVEFAFVRASYGGEASDLDERYAENVAGVRAAGLLLGHYHFAYPTSDDAQAEAEHFLATADLREGEPVVLDVEDDGLVQRPDIDRDELTEWLIRWADVVSAATGLVPILYTNPAFVDTHLAEDPRLRNLPLWVAHIDTDTPRIPDLWHQPLCWQYSWTGRVDGIDVDVDENHFYGSRDDWLAAGGAGRWDVRTDVLAGDGRVHRWSRNVKLDDGGEAVQELTFPVEMVVSVQALGGEQALERRPDGCAVRLRGGPGGTVELNVWLLRSGIDQAAGDAAPPSPPPAQPVPELDELLAEDGPLLSPGDTSPLVTAWQSFLGTHAGLPVEATGRMDDATVEATRRFQRQLGLEVDGVVGPATRRAALVLVDRPPAPAPSDGEAGGDAGMTEVQELLSSVLYPIAVDGELGQQTALAVRRFQRGYALEELAVDGSPGPATIAALRRCAADGGRTSPHFTFTEFACMCRARGLGGRPGFCNGQVWIDRRIVLVAEALREMMGPFSPLSACRCQPYNASIGGAASSKHMEGTAIDVSAVLSRSEVEPRVPDIKGWGTRDGMLSHADLGPPRSWTYPIT